MVVLRLFGSFSLISDGDFLFLFQHCTLDLGSYIKDLSVVHDDLSSIVILDNSPGAYRSHPGKTYGLILFILVCI